MIPFELRSPYTHDFEFTVSQRVENNQKIKLSIAFVQLVAVKEGDNTLGNLLQVALLEQGELDQMNSRGPLNPSHSDSVNMWYSSSSF